MRPLLTLIFLFLYGTSSAQTYYPLVKEGGVWKQIQVGWEPNGPTYFSFTTHIGEDTLVDGKLYNHFYSQSDKDTSSLNPQKGMLIREDTSKKVFYRSIQDSTETLLYDFGIQPGDTVQLDTNKLTEPHILNYIDTILISGQERRRYNFVPQMVDRSWIEGLGDLDNGFFGPYFILFEHSEEVGCYYDSAFYWARDKEKGCKYVDVKELRKPSHIQVFPIPTNGLIRLSGIEKELDYSVFSLSGQSIQQGSIEPGTSIDISDQPNGLYLLKLFNDKRLVGSFKILKK